MTGNCRKMEMHALPVHWRLAGLILVLGLLASGCGRDSSADLVEVKGSVTYPSGKPVRSVVLTFHPQEEKNQRNRPSVVSGYKDGTFVCRCLPGRYKVTAALPIVANGDPQTASPETPAPPSSAFPGAPRSIPNEYQSIRGTPWVLEVPPEGKDNVSFVLK
jgi:hypothetical protein